MAAAKSKRSTKPDFAQIIDIEAARLAGIVEILDHVGPASGIDDSIGVCRDVIDEVNTKISEVARDLRRRYAQG
ncbi:MAG: hypothetical protein A3G81_22550 [Betaproteobacteria bacterium RIFCSPLOWO2_12_FULL_65_14]|nr:MAG: hypothetical protein A3G81_22550 [Betaproteobacteria bacterium RIFCSPLOWO2_12_FULL_65_14]